MKIGDKVLTPEGGTATVVEFVYELATLFARVAYTTGVTALYVERDLVCLGSEQLPRPAKYDADKRRWDMLLADCDKSVDEVMKVLEFGLTKYGEGTTWKTVAPKRYKRAALRHLIASLRGATVNDEDGGVQHLAQAITGLLFALQNELDPSQQKDKP